MNYFEPVWIILLTLEPFWTTYTIMNHFEIFEIILSHLSLTSTEHIYWTYTGPYRDHTEAYGTGANSRVACTLKKNNDVYSCH